MAGKRNGLVNIRIWATQRLKEYIIKGFALNDERFKSDSSMNYLNENYRNKKWRRA